MERLFRKRAMLGLLDRAARLIIAKATMAALGKRAKSPCMNCLANGRGSKLDLFADSMDTYRARWLLFSK